ncbi:hypothetical protein HID58_050378 [Brassica napus]|uniref:Uncharacterized protein n=1 Tax=Brassica napus TaxID=3708 RepID=A0ABQ8A651_BRANA|nr:hypothetical protein HID58_050378 [Brassica napus]
MMRIPNNRQHLLPSNVLCVIMGWKQTQSPIKESMYFPHASLKDVSNSAKNILIQGLTEYLKSSNDHVESVAIRNATTDVRLQNLKIEIFVFPMGRENFTQMELDVISFALGTELYKAPAMFGSYYYKPDKSFNFFSSLHFIIKK